MDKESSRNTQKSLRRSEPQETLSLTTESTANREGKPSIWAGFYKKTLNERQDQVCTEYSSSRRWT